MLSWKFDGTGAWDALSGSQSQMWRIVVCDDGTFDISESDPDLTDHKQTFCSLESAQAFCLLEENKQHKPLRPLGHNQARFKARLGFRDWNCTTGCFEQGTGYYAEILGVIDDAVDFGWDAAKES